MQALNVNILELAISRAFHIAAGHERWTNAIYRAADILRHNTDKVQFNNGVAAIISPNGNLRAASLNLCQCESHTLNNGAPCKHKAVAGILTAYLTIERAVNSITAASIPSEIYTK